MADTCSSENADARGDPAVVPQRRRLLLSLMVLFVGCHGLLHVAYLCSQNDLLEDAPPLLWLVIGIVELLYLICPYLTITFAVWHYPRAWVGFTATLFSAALVLRPELWIAWLSKPSQPAMPLSAALYPCMDTAAAYMFALFTKPFGYAALNSPNLAVIRFTLKDLLLLTIAVASFCICWKSRLLTGESVWAIGGSVTSSFAACAAIGLLYAERFILALPISLAAWSIYTIVGLTNAGWPELPIALAWFITSALVLTATLLTRRLLIDRTANSILV